MSAFQPTQMLCPRCVAAARASGGAAPHLFAGVAGGMTVNACGTCGGVFLSPECAMRLASASPEGALALAASAAQGARYQPDLSHAVHCPVCRAAMVRTHAMRAGVEIDACRAHGTWYDRDELRRISEAIRSSGWGPPAGAVVAGVGVGVAAVGMGVAAAGANPYHPMVQDHSTAVDTALEIGSEVALEGGSEIVLEGVFGILGALFD